MMSLVVSLAYIMQIGLQPEAASKAAPDVRCGANCLAIVLRGLEIDSPSSAAILSQLGNPAEDGYSIDQLRAASNVLGGHALAVNTTFDNLLFRTRPFACIALIDRNHFVILSDVTASHVTVIDPPRSYETTISAFQGSWDGTALLISKEPLMSEEAIEWRRKLPNMVIRFFMAAVVIVVVMLVAHAKILRTHLSKLSSKTRSFFGLLAVLSCCSCSHSSRPSISGNAEHGKPVLFIHKESIDLGTLFKNQLHQEAHVEIPIENRGSAPLTIKSLTMSCTCTRSKMSSSLIAPNETATLHATIRLSDALEANSARIRIESTDPTRPQREISISWLIETPLRTPSLPSTLRMSIASQ